MAIPAPHQSRFSAVGHSRRTPVRPHPGHGRNDGDENEQNLSQPRSFDEASQRLPLVQPFLDGTFSGNTKLSILALTRQKCRVTSLAHLSASSNLQSFMHQSATAFANKTKPDGGHGTEFGSPSTILPNQQPAAILGRSAVTRIDHRAPARNALRALCYQDRQ
jgi:hypothetical protein